MYTTSVTAAREAEELREYTNQDAKNTTYTISWHLCRPSSLSRSLLSVPLVPPSSLERAKSFQGRSQPSLGGLHTGSQQLETALARVASHAVKRAGLPSPRQPQPESPEVVKLRAIMQRVQLVRPIEESQTNMVSLLRVCGLLLSEWITRECVLAMHMHLLSVGTDYCRRTFFQGCMALGIALLVNKDCLCRILILTANWRTGYPQKAKYDVIKGISCIDHSSLESLI